VTGDGASTLTLTQLANFIAPSINDKVFFYSIAKVTNAVAVSLTRRVVDDGGSQDHIIATPTQNIEYEHSEIITSGGGLTDYRIYATYSDAATANGKVMEVDGNAGVFAINLSNGISTYLTALGYATDEQQEAFMLSMVQAQGYFETSVISQKENLIVQSVSDPTVTFTTNITGTYSAGANLYRSNVDDDGTNYKMGGFGADPFTKSLLHMDGTDGSTTFTDESGIVWTANGNAEIDTVISKFGGASGKFDAIGDYITTNDPELFNFGAEDFSIDIQVQRSADGVTHYLFGDTDGANANGSVRLLFLGAGNIPTARFFISGGGTVDISGTTPVISNGTMVHIALEREGDDFRIYNEGTLEATGDVTGLTCNNSSSNVSIGRSGDSASTLFVGNTDEFRVVKGKAVWKGNFTPPTAAYSSNIGSVPLLEVDIRMNIASLSPVDTMKAWLFSNKVTGVTLDGSVAIHSAGADEIYTDLTDTEIDGGVASNYYVSTGKVTTADEVINLKYELTRLSTGDDVEIQRIQGAVS